MENKVDVIEAIPIAGAPIGGSVDPQWERLKTSKLPEDKGKEGLRLSMDGPGKTNKQKAIVEFLCPTRDQGRRRIRRDKDTKARDNENRDNNTTTSKEVDDGAGGRLKYVSYETEKDKDAKVLRLEWTTNHACENGEEDDGDKKPSSGHWGFFTWLIIM